MQVRVAVLNRSRKSPDAGPFRLPLVVRSRPCNPRCQRGRRSRVSCARSERPRRRPCRSDETTAPDERDPLEASVGRGWRESSKRSSASVGAGAPFRGKGIAGSRPSGRSLSINAIVARVARLGAGAPPSLGDRSSARFGGRRHSSPPWDQDRRPARTTASIRALARRLQARDARLWRDARRTSPTVLSPAFASARARGAIEVV
jgi:hypothetical protein